MDRVTLANHNISPQKDKILRVVGCPCEGAAHSLAARYFDEVLPELMSEVRLYAEAVCNDKVFYCALSLGEGVSALISRYFDDGEGMKGLIADALADEVLFEADAALSLEIKKKCAEKKIGIKKRLSAPEDFPLAEQPVILERLGNAPITLTDAFMFSPVKSMAYMLETTDDDNLFNAQHDCRRCSAKDCPRRSADYDGKFEILSDYAYTPEISNGKCAVCIDIGTTTLAFEYISAGERVSYKAVNPQRRFGYDVLSRVDAANRGRLIELKSDIALAIKKGLAAVTKGKKQPDKIIIAGNTTMVHLLLGASCATLGIYPFKSDHLAPVQTTLDRLLPTNEEIPVTVIGGISAFVGGDIVSGLYMCGFHKTDKINLFVDLGTNGEMAVGNRERIIATSAAAGPAFEGGMITSGMGSVDGAVCGVELMPLNIRTIGGKEPVGICGSGIIELVSEMLDSKIIDETGLLTGKYFENAFALTDKITFTQSDIRQVQTAKAAVRAGIECLLKEYGAGYNDIDTVYLAGGFGGALDARKAANIGIIPHRLKDKIKAAGNSSLGGCVKLFSENGLDETEKLRAVSKDFPLGENEKFNELYIKYMNFGKE